MNTCRRCHSWHADRFPWCFDCTVVIFGTAAGFAVLGVGAWMYLTS